MIRCLLIICCLFQPMAWATEFSSAINKTTIVELYTSEGCSSCPPADKWLSSLKSDPRLFKTLIPMAFHVDYWDQLGWPDRFAMTAYSNRQRALVKEGILSQVYTPGIVVDGREWRGWFNGKRDIDNAAARPGQLTAELNEQQLKIRFPGEHSYTAHTAVLGMGLETRVERGENRGRTLNHDFVVLQTFEQSGRGEWQMDITPVPQWGQKRTALVIWLTEPDSLSVIQAAGGYLD